MVGILNVVLFVSFEVFVIVLSFCCCCGSCVSMTILVHVSYDGVEAAVEVRKIASIPSKEFHSFLSNVQREGYSEGYCVLFDTSCRNHNHHQQQQYVVIHPAVQHRQNHINYMKVLNM